MASRKRIVGCRSLGLLSPLLFGMMALDGAGQAGQTGYDPVHCGVVSGVVFFFFRARCGVAENAMPPAASKENYCTRCAPFFFSSSGTQGGYECTL
jgi:hypothetical protein